ncbi:hypothetical protein [Cellulomonas fimi]|uniref:hypothetical protein n=1 Tax=Cellulomonas fimi TaxID=1708 RepID=UPI000F82A31D|nr:hypothetical protein [Cellulomonas fimi]NNH08133.1 hypothetical protein [Cellulomonas fimi]
MRQVVEAAVAGRVQVGAREEDHGGRLTHACGRYCRASLEDGRLVEDPDLYAAWRSRGAVRPVEWTSWAEPYA